MKTRPQPGTDGATDGAADRAGAPATAGDRQLAGSRLREALAGSASARDRRIDRLADAMTWPMAAELDPLDARLQVAIAQAASTLVGTAARLRALLRSALPEATVVALNDPSARVDQGVASEELDRFRPGDYLEVRGLAVADLRELAVTDPLAFWLGPILDQTLPAIEDGVSELMLATRRYALDQRQELRELLRCLPNGLLDRLEELAPRWGDDLAARRARLQTLAQRLGVGLPSDHDEEGDAAVEWVEELRDGLPRLRELVAVSGEMAFGDAERRALSALLAWAGPIWQRLERTAARATVLETRGDRGTG